jgi:xylulokinase
VSAAGAAATGIEQGTPVIAGTIDAWAEAASVGVRSPGQLMLMYGSTMFLVLGIEEPTGNPNIWTTRGIDPGSLTAAAGMATSGSLTTWFRELFGNPRFDDLIDESSTVAPGSNGVIVLPYFAGERTPIFDPDARGTILGLTLGHGRAHLYRAALEGIAFGVRHNLEVIAPQGATQTIAVGGGTRGELWVQIVSDVTGVTQEIPSETVGAAYGDALLAGEGAGLVATGTTWAVRQKSIAPQAAHTEMYDRLYPLYRELYVATAPLSQALAAIQTS